MDDFVGQRQPPKPVEGARVEVDDVRGAGKLPPQRDHLVEKQLEALHLHFRAREAIKQRAVSVWIKGQEGMKALSSGGVNTHLGSER